MPAPRFNVEYVDGTEGEIKMLPVAQIRFERKEGKSLGGDFGESVTDLYKLAWYAAGEPDTFEDWLETVEAVSGQSDGEGDDDAAPLPTTEQSPD